MFVTALPSGGDAFFGFLEILNFFDVFIFLLSHHDNEKKLDSTQNLTFLIQSPSNRNIAACKTKWFSEDTNLIDCYLLSSCVLIQILEFMPILMRNLGFQTSLEVAREEW